MTDTQPTPFYSGPPRHVVEFLEAAEIPTVVQKFIDFPLSEITAAMDGTFSVLFPVLNDQGIRPVGPAFALYEETPGETASFQVGVPVDRPLTTPVTAATGVVLEGSVLPGGPVATVSHVGAYERLGEAWGAFLEEVEAVGGVSALPFWELYVTEPTPESDPESMRTDLFTAVVP